MFLSVQFHRSGDDSRHGVDVEVFPVPVPGSCLQEGVADLSVHALVRVGGMDLVHRQAWRLLLLRQRELQKKKKEFQTV